MRTSDYYSQRTCLSLQSDVATDLERTSLYPIQIPLRLSIPPPTRHAPYQPDPRRQLPRLHCLELLTPYQHDADSEDGQCDVARDELEEVATLFLDDPSARLPCGDLARMHGIYLLA